MDSASLIVYALISGLTTGVTKVASAAVNDTYQELKKKLLNLVDTNADAKAALTRVELEPGSQSHQEVLREQLEKTHASEDTELLRLARDLLERLDAKPTITSKYNTQITGSTNIIIGDNSTVTQHAEARRRTKRRKKT